MIRTEDHAGGYYRTAGTGEGADPAGGRQDRRGLVMSRGIIALDRLASFLVGIGAIAAGAFAILWWRQWFSWLPRSLNTSPITDTTRQSWWPWVAALVGAAIMLAGLRWLAGHLSTSGVRELTLPGSGPEGKLRAAATHVAKADSGVRLLGVHVVTHSGSARLPDFASMHQER